MDTSIVPQKQCSKCGQEFPATAEYFHADKRVKSGLRADCRKCTSLSGRDYHAKNAAKLCEYQRKYRAEHSDAIHEQRLNYRIAHRRELRDRAREYLQKNPEKKREAVRLWRQKYPEKSRETSRRYQREHPEAARAHSAVRRARELSTGGTYGVADVRLQIKSQTDKRGRLRCWWCGKEIKEPYHVDHITPLSRGGANSPENLCIACPACNQSKHDKLLSEWNGRLL